MILSQGTIIPTPIVNPKIGLFPYNSMRARDLRELEYPITPADRSLRIKQEKDDVERIQSRQEGKACCTGR